MPQPNSNASMGKTPVPSPFPTILPVPTAGELSPVSNDEDDVNQTSDTLAPNSVLDSTLKTRFPTPPPIDQVLSPSWSTAQTFRPPQKISSIDNSIVLSNLSSILGGKNNPSVVPTSIPTSYVKNTSEQNSSHTNLPRVLHPPIAQSPFAEAHGYLPASLFSNTSNLNKSVAPDSVPSSHSMHSLPRPQNAAYGPTSYQHLTTPSMPTILKPPTTPINLHSASISHPPSIPSHLPNLNQPEISVSRSKVQQQLRHTNTTQASIENACHFLVPFAQANPKIVLEMIYTEFIHPILLNSQRLAIFYIINHLVHRLPNLHEHVFNKWMCEILSFVSQYSISEKRKYFRCINVWYSRRLISLELFQKYTKILDIPESEEEVDLLNTQHSFSTPSNPLVRVASHSKISDQLVQLPALHLLQQFPSSKIAAQHALNLPVGAWISLHGYPELQENHKKHPFDEFVDEEINEASKAFDVASRLTGQEVILIQSSLMDLATLTEDNHQEIINLKKKLDQEKIE